MNDVVRTSVACVGCGYDLRGLDESGVCPECGRPVVESTRGFYLGCSTPAHLARLERGLRIVLSVIAAQTLVFIVGLGGAWGGWGGQSGLALLAVLMLVGLVGEYGWWLFTDPDPLFEGKREAGERARVVVRATVFLGVCVKIPLLLLLMLELALSSVMDTANIVLLIAGLVAWAVKSTAAAMYVKRLALRFPQHGLSMFASAVAWALPPVVVVGFPIAMVGPLIGYVVIAVLLMRVRAGVARVRAVQREG